MDNMIEGADDFMLENVERNDLVDSGIIKKMAFERAGISKTHKKRMKKGTMITLIAAAAAVLALGTATVGASGSFDSVFGEYFAGESVDGLYAGGNASVDVKGGLKAEFLGVTGDNTSAYAAISVKKADGGSFADKDKDVVILLGEDISVDKNGKESIIDCFDYDVEMKNPIFDFSPHSFNSGYNCSLNSDDTINLLFSISGCDVDPKGKEFEFSAGPELYLYQIDKRLCEAEYGEAQSDKLYAQMKKYVPELKDGQVILRYYDEALDKWFLVIADKTVYNFELSAHVKMNYRTEYKEFDITSNKTVSYNRTKLLINEATAGAFTVCVKGESGSITEGAASDISDDVSKSSVYLTMKDGSRVECKCSSTKFGGQLPGEGMEGTADFAWTFEYSSTPRYRQGIIDPNDIVSLTVGDMTFNVK